MYYRRKLNTLLVVFALLLPGSAALAQWELDNARSTVNFVSIKNDSVAEVHSFSSLVGYIGLDGKVQLDIDLGSVETLVPIRNERMRELLFETVKFPMASISAVVDPAIIATVAQGGVVTTDLPVTLSLHGQDKSLTIPVVVVGEGDNHLRVLSSRPVVINAADFSLDGGVTALREIAGLKSINTAVPVTLQLVFVPAL